MLVGSGPSCAIPNVFRKMSEDEDDLDPKKALT